MARHPPPRFRRALVAGLLGLSLGALAGPFNDETGGKPALIEPDRRDKVAPSRTFDIEKMDLNVTIDPAKQAVSGEVTLTMTRLAPGPLVLDQVAIDIEAVRVGGQPVEFRIVGDKLEIPIDSARGARSEVAVRYHATPRTGLHFRGAASDSFPHVYSQGEDSDSRYWFPGWDFPNDRFVFTSNIRAPEGWKVVSNPTDDLVNYLVMVAAGPFEVVGQGDNTAYVPPGTPHSVAQRAIAPIPAMMAHFGERTGVPYPWGPYRQVFIERFLYSAMENTSATVLDRRLLTPDNMVASARGLESVEAHELAHQWYGDLLTCEDWQELWLNEGSATFMAADYMASRYGPVYAAADIFGLMSASLNGPALAGRFHQGPDHAESGAVYVKGASVLHMLRVMLGEEAFWAGIHRYTKTHQRGLVDSEDLLEAMEAASGQELDWFFQQWVELPFVPELSVTGRWADGVQHVTVRQARRPDAPLYTLPVTVELGGEGGVERVTGWLDDEELELSYPLVKPARFVAFDPDQGLLAKVEHEQDPAAWQAQLQSPSPGARLAAIRALGDTELAEPLVALLKDRTQDPVLRGAAARSLGEQRQAAPLLAALDEPDPLVLQAVVDGLGRCVGAPVRDALVALLKREKNLDISTAALRALGGVDQAAALGEARKAIRRTEREAEELRNAAADLIGAHGEARDLDVLLDPKLKFVRQIAPMWAAVHVVARQPEGPARDLLSARVARAIEPLLQDWDQRTRQAAIAQLGEVGDPQSVAALEAYRREEEVRDLQDSAREAITAITSRRAAPPAGPNEAEARVEALEKRLKALEEEMEAMRERR